MKTKILSSHLERRALVYVRQSTTAQIFEHQESTRRQYALTERAVSLGWSREAVQVIDEDQGQSGKSALGRTGFRRLAEMVAHGEAGAILAVEVSRLARSSEDWQRLLSLCAVAKVVVIDEQSVYDPDDHDDRLLLDLKGTMSEAELHWLALRLSGARRSKARRGELWLKPPTGYVWRDGQMVLDPDEAVQQALRVVFERFRVEGSAWAVVRWARGAGFRFPTRREERDGPSEVEWKPLSAARLYEVLHSPIYTGAYVFGRRPEKKVLREGTICVTREIGRDPEKWAVKLEGHHPAYLSWEEYVKNQERLRQNTLSQTTQGAPREGPTLLSGLLLCGRCGRKMRASYRGSGEKRRWYYHCVGNREVEGALCWTVLGPPLDEAVERLFLATMVPSELELSLAVEREAGTQAESLEKSWRARLEQAQYEARRAERRYKAVDPENRVVARTLERDWEQSLKALAEVEEHYASARRKKVVELSEEDRQRIRALATDLPKVWRAATTSAADRKAMLRLVVEVIALMPVEVPRRATRVRVQWQSGAVSELEVARAASRPRKAKVS